MVDDAAGSAAFTLWFHDSEPELRAALVATFGPDPGPRGCRRSGELRLGASDLGPRTRQPGRLRLSSWATVGDETTTAPTAKVRIRDRRQPPARVLSGLWCEDGRASRAQLSGDRLVSGARSS